MTSRLSLIAALGLVTLLSACDSKNDSGSNTGAQSAPKVAETGKTIGQDASDGKTGVAECDKYIDAYKACLEKAPAEARESMEKGLAATIESWRSADQGYKETIAKACKSTYDMSSTSMKAMGCDW